MINYTEKCVLVSSSGAGVMPQLQEKQSHLKCRCLPCWLLLCCTAEPPGLLGGVPAPGRGWSCLGVKVSSILGFHDFPVAGFGLR